MDYRYFQYPDSDRRKELQRLLSSPGWSEDILAAAEKYGWTHLLVRKDHPHPYPMRLEKTFENDAYQVFPFKN